MRSAYLLILFLSVLLRSDVIAQRKFSFAFFTDIHLYANCERQSAAGLRAAIHKAEAIKEIDFILTGGDNVVTDRLRNQKKLAYQLYSDLKGITDSARLPFYFTMGNHDRYLSDSKQDEYENDGLFRSFFGDPYFSFTHKGWLFIVLNSAMLCDGKYCIDSTQRNWLSNLLSGIARDQPIVVSTHIPFLSVYYPVLEGRFTQQDTFVNQKEIFELFSGHNLKLVLQGHQHLYEEIKVKNVQFITAGAVCANWWQGSYHGTEEGFLMVHADGDKVRWEYVDYGWEVDKMK